MSVISQVIPAIEHHSQWILWNLFLALIPLALSVVLFRRRSRSRSLLWWAGLLMFIAFLPNAPYLLTDIIHLIQATRAGYPIWVIALGVLPIHLSAIVIGFEAYVLAVMNQSSYLKRAGWGIVWAELLTHALCAIAVYLGRFRRFNSWDLVTDPGNVLLVTIDDLTDKRPLLAIGVTFLALTVLYWLAKQMTLGLGLRIQAIRGRNPRSHTV